MNKGKSWKEMTEAEESAIIHHLIEYGFPHNGTKEVLLPIKKAS